VLAVRKYYGYGNVVTLANHHSNCPCAIAHTSGVRSFNIRAPSGSCRAGAKHALNCQNLDPVCRKKSELLLKLFFFAGHGRNSHKRASMSRGIHCNEFLISVPKPTNRSPVIDVIGQLWFHFLVHVAKSWKTHLIIACTWTQY
jgi:hypothetical protein